VIRRGWKARDCDLETRLANRAKAPARMEFGISNTIEHYLRIGADSTIGARSGNFSF
jgi:hypothetical protein